MRINKLFTILLVAVFCLSFLPVEVDAKKKEVKETIVEGVKEKYTKDGNKYKTEKQDEKKQKKNKDAPVDEKKNKKGKKENKQDKSAVIEEEAEQKEVEQDVEETTTDEIVAEPLVADVDVIEEHTVKEEKKVKAVKIPETLDPDVLLAQTLKLRRKILEAESAPSKTANQKLQRMQDTYADYQKQLEIAGIDFAAEAEQEDKAQAQQEKLKNLEAEFSDAWREHNGLARREAPANECGCQKEARLEREAEETAKAKVDKSQFSMRERIEYKIASLEAKVEEQRFRLQWFGDQGIDVDAKTVVADKAEVVKDEL